jgi:hypothetical protein
MLMPANTPSASSASSPKSDSGTSKTSATVPASTSQNPSSTVAAAPPSNSASNPYSATETPENPKEDTPETKKEPQKTLWEQFLEMLNSLRKQLTPNPNSTEDEEKKKKEEEEKYSFFFYVHLKSLATKLEGVSLDYAATFEHQNSEVLTANKSITDGLKQTNTPEKTDHVKDINTLMDPNSDPDAKEKSYNSIKKGINDLREHFNKGLDTAGRNTDLVDLQNMEDHFDNYFKGQQKPEPQTGKAFLNAKQVLTGMKDIMNTLNTEPNKGTTPNPAEQKITQTSENKAQTPKPSDSHNTSTKTRLR